MDRFDQDFWDERYGAVESLWSGSPNHNLVVEAAGLVPGKALDVACGEGADTIWLAEQGWEATGVDISDTALGRARAACADVRPAVAGRITWIRVDLREWSPPVASFDLVSAQYLHLPQALREDTWPRLAAAVSPGGTLLVVAHDPDDPHVLNRHEEHLEERRPLFYTGDEIAGHLDGDWTVTKCAVEPRRRRGDDTEFVDLVFKARRSPVSSR